MMSGNGPALQHAAALREQGVPLVAVIGWRVPVEPIMACGMVPILIRPDLDMPTPDADALLSADERTDVRSLVQMIIGGTLDFAELVVIAPPFTSVSLTVEELRRLDLIERSVPGIFYFELQVERNEPNRAFTHDRVMALALRMCSASGSGAPRPSRAALEASIAATNRVRQAARELEAKRREAAYPSGSAVMAAMGSSDWLRPEDHLAEVNRLIAAPCKPSSGPRALLVSSSVLGNDRVHSVVEQAGATVVGEDDIYGSVHSSGDIAEGDANPLGAIADFYHDNPPPQRTNPEDLRRAWFANAIQREDVDCVIFYAEYAFWGWDLPEMRRLAAEAGKPTITLELDVRIAAEKDQARETLAEFVCSLGREAQS